jgi:hypothetical protein
MLAEIEQAIVNQLLQPLQSDGVRVTGFPDNPNDLGRPVGIGQVLVGFKKESLSPVTSGVLTAPIIQTHTFKFEVSLQLKNLRSHGGAYPLMDKIRSLLTGFKPLGEASKPMYQSEGGFVDLKEGIWYYSMIFDVPATYCKKLI